ncbi:MAG: DNA-processing protein DprA [Anaerolineae bacterium]
MSERQYWLGFNLVKGVGPARVARLLEVFGSLREAWHANPAALAGAGLDQRTLESFEQTRRRFDLGAELARLDRLGIALFTWDDPEYPVLLSQLRLIDQAPPVLYVRGTLLETDEWAITVVGTRSVSAYGRQVTHQLAADMAASGLTIVSGLARGVDAVAHQAALEAGGRTIALLPCGLDQIYPPEHRSLAARIMRSGALISIFPLGTTPDAHKFPIRNRVMSGLGRGVLVTEAGDKSGALLTAGYALEQGREVFAVPGNITTRSSMGVNRLIQDGAHPVLSAQDIFEVLKLEHVAEYAAAREELPDLSADERRVLECLSADPRHVDELARMCALPVSQVTGALTLLALKGMIREVGVMTYVRS